MAVTITAAALRAAMRLGDTTEETAEATRLLAYGTEAVSQYLGDAFADTPAVVVNEAVVRLAAYLFDQPHAGRGSSFANALRSSGAAAILAPYRVHRAGLPPATTTTTPDPSTPDDPSGAGVDQTARDSAAAALAAAQAAQGTADANAASLTAHAANASAHHTKTPEYTLPAAAPGTRGGVQAVTNAIIDAGTSTGIFGWAISHVRRLVEAVVPAWARADSPPAATVSVSRFTITFDASSYDYQTEANTGVSGGVSYLTASYPTGLDMATAAAGVKFGFLDVDPHQSAKHEGPIVERTTTTMRGHTEGATVTFRSGDLRLELLGLELAAANQRDTWRLRLALLAP